MRRASQISVTDSPKEVNELLVTKSGVSLFKFAQVFAVSPADLILLRNDYPFNSREISIIKKNLIAMRKTLLDRGRVILSITDKLWEAPRSLTESELIKHMRLEEFFADYMPRHEDLVRYASKMSLQGKRGSAINQKSIISLGWGNLVASKGRRIDWQTLGDLYYWFWERVSTYESYEKLRPSEGIEEYLRHQYVRYRWRRKDVLERASKNIRTVFNLISALMSHQFMGNQKEYIREKLNLTESEFPAFFMNFIVDYFLSGREGLTIFSRNQAIADPLYLFMKVRLGKSFAKSPLVRFLSWMFPKGPPSPEGQELPFRSTEIREYFDVAASIYAKNGISVRRPVPLIVFPDRSFFSVSF